MKILHINSYYGESIFYKNLYDRQVKNEHDISVYVPTSKKFDKSKYDYGEYTNISKCYNKYDRIIFHLKHNKIFRDIKNKYNAKEFDMIHAHSLFSNGYIAYKLNKLYNLPYIVAVRNTDANVFFKRMIHLRKLGIEILKNAQNLIFISEAYKYNVLDKYVPNKYKNEIAKKSMVIPNGVEEFWLNNKFEREYKKFDDKKIKLIFAGQVDKNKNVITTAKACNILIEKGYDVTYTIVGKVENKNIFNKLSKLNFINYITRKSKEELICLYRENDIYVMPSKTETFGISYIEALSQGLPLIYSKGQGFDGQFEEGIVGYHVDSMNPKDIANKIEMIIQDYNNISERCAINIHKYNWESISLLYEKYI